MHARYDDAHAERDTESSTASWFPLPSSFVALALALCRFLNPPSNSQKSGSHICGHVDRQRLYVAGYTPSIASDNCAHTYVPTAYSR